MWSRLSRRNKEAARSNRFGKGSAGLFTMASRLPGTVSRTRTSTVPPLQFRLYSFALEEHMLAKAFVVAMAADIARSDYAKPTLIRSRSREWLIACRWGPDGEYLSIATAGAMMEPHGLSAPASIAPIHSLVGVLVAESDTEDRKRVV